MSNVAFTTLGVEVDAIDDVVRSCSREALDFFRSHATAVDNKLDEGFDPVTAADRHVERLLREHLRDLVGDLPVIGEEEGVTGDPSQGLAWIIDPIDGTRAFISGQPQWGTIVGLLNDGSPIAGWMHLPVLDESYTAVGNQLTHRSGLPNRANTSARASGCADIAHATMCSTHPPDMFTGDLADRFATLEASVKLSRFGGDCHNYGLLASGDVDLVVENLMQPYDILPLVPIIEAAGAVVTDGLGNPPLEGGMIIAAATPELHRAAFSAMVG